MKEIVTVWTFSVSSRWGDERVFHLAIDSDGRCDCVDAAVAAAVGGRREPLGGDFAAPAWGGEWDVLLEEFSVSLPLPAWLIGRILAARFAGDQAEEGTELSINSQILPLFAEHAAPYFS